LVGRRAPDGFELRVHEARLRATLDLILDRTDDEETYGLDVDDVDEFAALLKQIEQSRRNRQPPRAG
jgi:hypothetical protein